MYQYLDNFFYESMVTTNVSLRKLSLRVQRFLTGENTKSVKCSLSHRYFFVITFFQEENYTGELYIYVISHNAIRLLYKMYIPGYNVSKK